MNLAPDDRPSFRGCQSVLLCALSDNRSWCNVVIYLQELAESGRCYPAQVRCADDAAFYATVSVVDRGCGTLADRWQALSSARVECFLDIN